MAETSSGRARRISGIQRFFFIMGLSGLKLAVVSVMANIAYFSYSSTPFKISEMPFMILAVFWSLSFCWLPWVMLLYGKSLTILSLSSIPLLIYVACIPFSVYVTEVFGTSYVIFHFILLFIMAGYFPEGILLRQKLREKGFKFSLSECAYFILRTCQLNSKSVPYREELSVVPGIDVDSIEELIIIANRKRSTPSEV